jgi:hypothetical protein
LGDGDPLLHAAGELVRIFTGIGIVQTKPADIVQGFLPKLATATEVTWRQTSEQIEFVDFRPEGDVAENGLSGKSEYF